MRLWLWLVELTPMNAEERFSAYCLARGYACTAQRRKLVTEIFKDAQPFGVNDLLDRLTSSGFAVSRATIWRTLAILQEAGMIHREDGGYSVRKSDRA
jgi:Fe2+ or Zn2+ uptake regulation protein